MDGSEWLHAIDTGVQVVTIIVLIFTCRAAFMQAKAALKLTEATERQIKTSSDQAQAAKELVTVAKRQITESLRPILTARVTERLPRIEGMEEIVLTVKNEGAGVALDVWWTYGKPGVDPFQRIRVQDGIVPPQAERSFTARKPSAYQEGILVVYDSLSGITFGTGLNLNEAELAITYYNDIDDWARRLLGRLLSPPRQIR